MKKGFTLIELLVVIGIIAVLSSVMIGMMRGSSASAQATKCMTNIRALTVAAVNFQVQNDNSYYPAAGTYKYIDFQSSGVVYPESRGWVASNPGGGSKSKACPASIPFTTEDMNLGRFAITNGAIWNTGSKSDSVYRCPVHEKAYKEHSKGRVPLWSYVMNQKFGYQNENVPGGFKNLTRNMFDNRSPDKVLLFAEMQAITDSKRGLVANMGEGGESADGVLQFETEHIGFNHEQDRGKLAGHVSFADGHVEKLICPSGNQYKEMTKWLCEGHEIAFDGKDYRDLQN